MAEVENRGSRFIGETTRYQVRKFNKGLSERIKLDTGCTTKPINNDMVFVNNTKKMKTDAYLCVGHRLMRVDNWPKEDNRGKVNRVQGRVRGSVSIKRAVSKRKKV